MATILIDLDGTLADVSHRLHHVQGRRKNWDAFFAGMAEDPLNAWCRELMRGMKALGHTIAIVSGRPDDYEREVRNWLTTHDAPFDRLLLRQAGDFRPDTVVKQEILHEHFDKDDILFIVDDRQGVVDMWREQGLVCLQCEPHDC